MKLVKAYPYKSIDNYIQDQTSYSLEGYMVRPLNQLTLAESISINDITVTITDDSLVTVGNYVSILKADKAYQSKILSKADNVLTLDSPFYTDFPIDSFIREGNINLNINGSVTPVIAIFKPPKGVAWDIYGVAINITDQSPMDDALFGGINGLTNGVVLTKINGSGMGYFNIKTNGNFRLRGDLIYSDKAPSGFYGLAFIKNFHITNGVAIRLDGDNDEYLELIVQDNLTGLDSFNVIVRGHVVEY